MATRVGTKPINQSKSFFDGDDYGQQSLVRAQVNLSAPSSSLSSGTSLIVPDRHYDAKLQHFFEEIYDLRPQSHLVRFLKALLGDSGVGQLRKRYTIYRLQSAQASTHFYDLDGFYGALFGAHRNPEEILPLNPLLDTATGAQWDDIHSSDTRYRERIFHLAKGVALGATVAGLQTAAEAIFGCPCDVYEAWALIDAYNLHGHSQAGDPETWFDMEADYPTYADVEGNTYDSLQVSNGGGMTQTWSDVVALHPTYDTMSTTSYDDLGTLMPTSVQIGPSLFPNRAEFIVRPHKVWNTPQQQAADEWSALRVLETIKPAGSLITIDPQGLPLHEPVSLAGCDADSDYWEVVTRVTPKSGLVASLYPTSAVGTTPTTDRLVPRPAFTDSQGEFMSYNTEIVAVQTYVEVSPGVGPGGTDSETVVFYDGSQTTYSGERAILTPKQVLAARFASEGVMVAAPYSQNRSVAVPHE